MFLTWSSTPFAIYLRIFAQNRSLRNRSILQRKIIHERTTLCSRIRYPQFVLPRHKHAEYEIMLFTRGSGKQFVGESVLDYRAGDVALIGSNVPHLHLCNAKLNPGMELETSAGEALQFHPSIFPAALETLPDYRPIHELLQRSQCGIRFCEKGLFEELKRLFRELESVEHTARLIRLLQILERLTQCRQTQTLSETAYYGSFLPTEANEPVNRVYTYLFHHFKEKITLKDIAAHVRQHPSALCRYFRQRTDKTIFRCLAEIRTEHACKLLDYSHLTVAQVAYESGYNNVSYFIKQFEELVHCTPSEYRMQLDNRL